MSDFFPQRRRVAARGWALALSIALAAHVGILAGLILGIERPAIPGGAAPVEVNLIPTLPTLPDRPLSLPKPARRRGRITGLFSAPTASAQPSPPLTSPAEARAAPPSEKTDLARLGAALRAGGVGCGLEGARLTAAEREACHERLGAGAADAAYITAVPPQKRAYYAALQASEAKLAHDPLGGHAPGIICGKGAQTQGFKLGGLPCAFSPSPSPWAPEMDVRPP